MPPAEASPSIVVEAAVETTTPQTHGAGAIITLADKQFLETDSRKHAMAARHLNGVFVVPQDAHRVC